MSFANREAFPPLHYAIRIHLFSPGAKRSHTGRTSFIAEMIPEILPWVKRRPAMAVGWIVSIRRYRLSTVNESASPSRNYGVLVVGERFVVGPSWLTVDGLGPLLVCLRIQYILDLFGNVLMWRALVGGF